MSFLEIFIESGGEDAGKMEIVKTKEEDAYKYAKKLFEKKDESIEKELPNFKSNYEAAQKAADRGKTIRKDMPVIDTGDIKEFQRRLENGYIDINLKHKSPNTDAKNPFPEGLTGEKAKKWLKDGLKTEDGSSKDDKISVKITKVQASKLKPIQKQIYFDKSISSTIENGINNTKSFLQNKSILIISKDNYIIDGHHRYLSAMLVDPSMDVKVLQIDLPIKILLPLSLAYGDAIGNARNESSDDMTDKIKLMREIKKKYNLKKLPVHISDDFDPEFTYDTTGKNGKMRIYVNTKSFSSPVYDYEWI